MLSKQFILAGKAVFTVSNGKGRHFTFLVQKSKVTVDRPKPYWFVKVLNGADNQHSYAYMGLLNKNTGSVTLTPKSKVGEDALSLKVVEWAFRHIWREREPAEGEILHSNKCGRCGRSLTTPESIKSGIGPECSKKVG